MEMGEVEMGEAEGSDMRGEITHPLCPPSVRYITGNLTGCRGPFNLNRFFHIIGISICVTT